MRREKIFQQLIYWPVFLLFKLFFRYKIEGQGNLSGLEDKPVIFVSNHLSYLDGPVSAAAMPREGFVPKSFFPVKFLVNEQYCDKSTSPFPKLISRIVEMFLKANEVIPVPSIGKKYLKEDIGDWLDKAVEMIVRYPVKIWIFPQGKLSQEGEIRRIRGGAVYLHQKTGAVVVPVILKGLENLSFKSVFLRKVVVKFGEPLSYIPAGIEGRELLKEKLLELGKK